MIDFGRFYHSLVNTPLQPWSISLPPVLEKKAIAGHGLWPQWQQLLRELPLHHVDLVDFNAAAGRILLKKYAGAVEIRNGSGILWVSLAFGISPEKYILLMIRPTGNGSRNIRYRGIAPLISHD